ncbi:MAG: hypothetical protein K2N64_02650 [Anaeroplasmataceae bacterium]|nr:hypothetical protein [Anaeroplasmataceae bacterium]
MQHNSLESIWVDGIPSRIEKEDLLEPKAVLQMCIRFTLDHILKDKGYEITAVQDDPVLFPNIEAKKFNKKYAIAVIPCIYPHFIAKNDALRIGFAKAAKEKNYIPILCPVPIRSTDKLRAEASIYLKGDMFQFANIGQMILTDEDTQEILPKNLNFKL